MGGINNTMIGSAPWITAVQAVIDSYVLDPITANRIVYKNGSGALEAVADLTSWIAGTANQITVTDDTDGTMTISLPSSISTPGDLTVTGDLTVSGTTVTVNAETVQVEDNVIVVNYGEAGAGVTNGIAGIQVDRGTATDYQLIFRESDDVFVVGEIGSLQVVATREDSPTNNGLAIWDSATLKFETDSNLVWDATTLTVTDLTFTGNTIANGSTGVNINDPGTEGSGIDINGTTYDVGLRINDIGGDSPAELVIHRHSTSIPATLIGTRSNSATSSHTAVTNGQQLFRIVGAGWSGTHYDVFGDMFFAADDTGTIGATSSPGKMVFRITPDASNTPAAWLTVTNNKAASFAGDIDLAASTSLSFNGTDILADSAGSMTLSNIDALDATTTTTFESAVENYLSAGDGIDYASGVISADINTTNLKFTTGEINTIQDIDTTASPSFAGLTISGFTQGSVLFAGSSGQITEDNSNFFWDDTNDILYLGTNASFTGGLGSPGLAILGDMVVGSTSATDLATKSFLFAGAHYNNAEEPVGALYIRASSTDNDVYYGGGSGFVNAPTRLFFYGANDTTTSTGSEWMRLQDDGGSSFQFGINETSPQTLVHISGDNGGSFPTAIGDEVLSIQRNSSNAVDVAMLLLSGNTGEAKIYFGDANDADIGRISYDHSTNSFNFYTNNTLGMTLNSTQDLTVVGDLSAANLAFDSATLTGFTTGSILFITTGSTITEDNSNFFWDDTNNRLGIGTNTPDYPFHISTSSNNAIGLYRTNWDANDAFLYAVSGTVGSEITKISWYDDSAATTTDIIYFRSDGRVGVGTVSPASVLHVYESTTATSTTNGITIEQASTGDAQLQFLLTAVTRWVMGIDNSDSDSFKIAASAGLDSNTYLEIDTSGNMYATVIETSSNLRVATSSSPATASIDGTLVVGSIDASGDKFRFINSGGFLYMQGGVDSSDTTAAMRVVRYGTTTTNISSFELYADDISLYGDLVSTGHGIFGGSDGYVSAGGDADSTNLVWTLSGNGSGGLAVLGQNYRADTAGQRYALASSASFGFQGIEAGFGSIRFKATTSITSTAGATITEPTTRMTMSSASLVMNTIDIDLNDNTLFLRDTAGNAYGLAYNDYGATEMVMFSDDGIAFSESDASIVRASWSMNNATFSFYGKVWAQNTAVGFSGIYGNTPGHLVTSGGMNTTSKYTPGYMFGSTDNAFTTENPKILAGIYGVCTEQYAGDSDSGMDLEFYVSNQNAGTSNTQELEMTLSTTGLNVENRYNVAGNPLLSMTSPMWIVAGGASTTQKDMLWATDDLSGNPVLRWAAPQDCVMRSVTVARDNDASTSVTYTITVENESTASSSTAAIAISGSQDANNGDLSSSVSFSQGDLMRVYLQITTGSTDGCESCCMVYGSQS